MRGKIRNREFASRLRDFSGMVFGSITPTDMDGFFEVKNRLFIFIEIKHGNAKMPHGQELAFIRLVDLVEPPKYSLLVIGKDDSTIGDILVHKCICTQYRSNKKWYYPSDKTVKEVVDAFLKAKAFSGPNLVHPAQLMEQ